MKKILNSLYLFAFVIAISLSGLAQTADDLFETDLVAAGGNVKGEILIGQVKVWNDGSKLYVKYLIGEEEWCMTASHLHVAISLEGIPQKNGNPIPGLFEYNQIHECLTEYTYEIPLTWPVGTNLYIAAHADVCTKAGLSSHVEAFAEMLPDTVTMSLIRPGPMSYFQITISGGTALDGIYDGWCVDIDRDIDVSVLHNAKVFSSYEELPLDLIEKPENLDLVNWILNQNFVGKISPSQGVPYPPRSVQLAIWQLLEDEYPSEPNYQPYVDEIIAAAEANGEGYVPGCFELMGVILVPFDGEICPSGQLTIIPVVVPCVEVQCETAWGRGFNFPGRNWAMYFTYEIQ